jgi:O-antigen ligase
MVNSTPILKKDILLHTGHAKKIALFLVPITILGISPRTWGLAIFLSITYLFISFLFIKPTLELWRVYGYVGLVSAYLTSSVLLVPFLSVNRTEISSYGLEKVLFVLFAIFPFGLAVSSLTKKPTDLFYILWGYIILGIFIGILSAMTGSRTILGEERYQWQGNLCAISALILIQFWLVKKKWIALSLFLISITGVAVAAARQSYGVLAIGILAIILLNLFEFKKNMKANLIIIIFLISIVIFWGIIKKWQIMEVSLNKLNRMRSQFGSIDFLQRGTMWKLAWSGFKESPIFGIGIGEYSVIFGNYFPDQFYPYPHNTMLEILAELGLIGFLVLIFPLFYAAILMIKKYSASKDQPFRHLLVLFLATATMANLTGDLTTRPMWIFGILMIRFISFKSQSKNLSKPQKHPNR